MNKLDLSEIYTHKNNTYQVRLPPMVWKLIKDEAKTHGMTMGKYLTTIIINHLNEG